MASPSILTPAAPMTVISSADTSVPSWSRIWLTISLTLLCVGITLVPSADDWLQFDRTKILSGQWWRVITGHLTHWNAEHLGWDLSVFAALGVICERMDRRRFVVGLLSAGLLIPLAAWMFLPTLATYRGLSGLDTALFTLVAACALKANLRDEQWGWVVAIGGLLFGLAAKIGIEMMTGGALFVDTAGARFQPVPLAHVIGALSGVLAGVCPSAQSRFTARQTPGDHSLAGTEAWR